MASRRIGRVGVGVLLAGAAWACGRGEARSESAGRGERVQPVAVAVVERRDLARHVSAAAPVEPVRTVGVNSQASGTVLAVRVQEGDRVRPGQVLAELDARESEAQLARARAVLDRTAAAYARDSALHASTIITDAEFEASRSAYDVARSDVALWETRRAFTRIVSPAPGVVTAKLVEAGSAVAPNQRLFDLADVSLLVVRLRLSELDVVHLTAGAPVVLRLDAFPDAQITGRVRRVFPSADPQSRLVPVEVALERPPAGVAVKPGFLARAEFLLDHRPGVLVIPASAVGVANAGPFVYTVDADTLAAKPVSLGLSSEGLVEVTAGLVEGERVVISGHANLRRGAAVSVIARPTETARPAP